MYMRKRCDEEKEGGKRGEERRGDRRGGGRGREGKRQGGREEVLAMDSKSFCFRMPSLSTWIY